jgi:hypothetical protein
MRAQWRKQQNSPLALDLAGKHRLRCPATARRLGSRSASRPGCTPPAKSDKELIRSDRRGPTHRSGGGLFHDRHRLRPRSRTTGRYPPIPRASLLSTSEICVVFSTYVTAAAPAHRCNSEWAAACEKTSLSEVLAQRGLHNDGKRWRRFLGLPIVVNGFG